MSAVQQKRLIVVVSLICGCAIALGLILTALSQNIDLFFTPTQLLSQSVPNKTIRVGGMVVINSVVRHENRKVEFTITDYNHQLKISYQGILPDLFKEGQGIVALGKLDKKGNFIAHQVLAKHDEKYMPPEVAAGLKGRAT